MLVYQRVTILLTCYFLVQPHLVRSSAMDGVEDLSQGCAMTCCQLPAGKYICTILCIISLLYVIINYHLLKPIGHVHP
jgi:hypothetical protein